MFIFAEEGKMEKTLEARERINDTLNSLITTVVRDKRSHSFGTHATHNAVIQ
jgi:hypothetical protein